MLPNGGPCNVNSFRVNVGGDRLLTGLFVALGTFGLTLGMVPLTCPMHYPDVTSELGDVTYPEMTTICGGCRFSAS